MLIATSIFLVIIVGVSFFLATMQVSDNISFHSCYSNSNRQGKFDWFLTGAMLVVVVLLGWFFSPTLGEITVFPAGAWFLVFLLPSIFGTYKGRR
jgi:hypothetical protein